MCGFVGFFTNSGCCEGVKNATYDRSNVLERMKDSIKHRGPDSEGSYIDDDVALGFRRLSIIDLRGGDQPQKSADERYVIVFNGEIYNYRELRAMLKEKHNAEFSTNSDTETILRTYEFYGEKTASMLRGMFAFVIYDKQEKKLYGARDRFGIKPFFYTKMGDEFIFGSEIKAFLHHPAFKKEVNKDALKMYLVFQYVPTKETMFKNVYRLIPGTQFTYADGRMEETVYFKARFEEDDNTFDEAVERIDKVVDSSVEYHQIADVEVGSFLSGGVDSSYIASVAKPDKTYSVGFQIEGFDETDLAGDLCKILKINNKKKEITPNEFFDVLPKVQYFSDEPHANLSAVPLFFLAELAAKDVKVVLSGEGADEFFGGYDLYIEGEASRKYLKLPLGLRKFFAATIGNLPVSKVKQFLKANAKPVEEYFIGEAFIMNNEQADAITKEEYKSNLRYQDITYPFYSEVQDKDTLTKKMYLDLNLWLPYDILLKADRMTMAHSLELRVPFIDSEVWKVAKGLTSDQRVVGRNTKRAFRKAALSHIPTDWAQRKKAGFMVPFRVWIRDEKYAKRVREVISSDYAAKFFDTELLNKMLDKHISQEENNARVIYTVYSFLLWYNEYFN